MDDPLVRDDKVTATARVTMTIEVDTDGGAWGHDCTVAQVYKQALDGVRNRMEVLFRRERGIRIQGEMKVTMIAFPVKKD